MKHDQNRHETVPKYGIAVYQPLNSQFQSVNDDKILCVHLQTFDPTVVIKTDSYFLCDVLSFSAVLTRFPVSAFLNNIFQMHLTGMTRLASQRAGQMRVWQVQSPGESIQLKTVPMPILTKPNQVLIKVKVSVCFYLFFFSNSSCLFRGRFRLNF